MKYIKEFVDYSNRIENWNNVGKSYSELSSSLGANEFNIAYNWIEQFGGRELLYSKYIVNGISLLKSLENGDITIDEIDTVTKGKHGQVGDIPFSETHVCKTIVIPHIEAHKNNNNI